VHDPLLAVEALAGRTAGVFICPRRWPTQPHCRRTLRALRSARGSHPRPLEGIPLSTLGPASRRPFYLKPGKMRRPRRRERGLTVGTARSGGGTMGVILTRPRVVIRHRVPAITGNVAAWLTTVIVPPSVEVGTPANLVPCICCVTSGTASGAWW
jgi:hypothetical protein